MAVVGSAKNAQLKVRAVPHDYGEAGFAVNVRGKKYYIDSYDDNHSMSIVKNGTQRIAFTNYEATIQTYTVELIDSSIKVYAENGSILLSANDSTYLVAGDWEIITGTLISFDNLDTPSKVRKLLSKGEQVKTCYSLGEPVKKLYAYGNLIYEA